MPGSEWHPTFAGVWLWAANMDGQCSLAGTGGPQCFAQILGQGMAPLVGSLAVLAIGMAVLTTLLLG